VWGRAELLQKKEGVGKSRPFSLQVPEEGEGEEEEGEATEYGEAYFSIAKRLEKQVWPRLVFLLDFFREVLVFGEVFCSRCRARREQLKRI
jgi:hypothetical protein